MTWRLVAESWQGESLSGNASVWATTREPCSTRYSWVTTTAKDLDHHQGWAESVAAAKAAAEAWLSGVTQ